jgi:hypothetical protein
MPVAKKNVVPKNAENPIEYLLSNGTGVIELAVAWGLKQNESVYRLRRFAHVPHPKTAAKMAASFGWTAGEVIDFWLAKIARRSA